MSIATSKLGDQATIIMGQSPPGESYNKTGNGAPLLNGPSEFGPLNPLEKQWTTSPTKFCQAGDVLFCVRGATAGRLNLADKEYCLGRGLAAIRGKPGKFDNGFLRYVLANGYSTFQSRGVGSTFININGHEFENFVVPAFPLSEQRRIAAVLDRAEALRAKRRAALAELESLTESIFLDLFGDPATNPKLWPRTQLAELVSEFRYGTSNKSQSHGSPALRIPNVAGGAVDLAELKLVPVEPAELERLRLRDGDLLFVRTNGNPNYVGRCAVFDRARASESGFPPDEFIYASYLIRARLAPNIILPVFLREFLLGAEGRRQLLARSKTSAGQFNINTESLGVILIPVPPISLQQVFARQVTALEKLKTSHVASLAELDALFAALQHRAFRGEL